VNFDLYLSFLVTCSVGHLRKKIATHVCSAALDCKKVLSMKSFEVVSWNQASVLTMLRNICACILEGYIHFSLLLVY